MRSLAMLSASPAVATTAATAASRHSRALAPAQTRRPAAAAFAVAAADAAGKAERRGVVSAAAASSSRRSVRVSVSARDAWCRCSAQMLRRKHRARAIPKLKQRRRRTGKETRWPKKKKTSRKNKLTAHIRFVSPSLSSPYSPLSPGYQRRR